MARLTALWFHGVRERRTDVLLLNGVQVLPGDAGVKGLCRGIAQQHRESEGAEDGRIFARPEGWSPAFAHVVQLHQVAQRRYPIARVVRPGNLIR